MKTPIFPLYSTSGGQTMVKTKMSVEKWIDVGLRGAIHPEITEKNTDAVKYEEV